MYKDKEKQKEANKIAKQKSRQGMTSGVTEGMTNQGMTSKGMTESTGMTREGMTGKPAGYDKGITKGITELELNRQVLQAATHNPKVQHLAEVMTDPIRRKKLQMIVDSFAQSSRPEYSREVYYGIGGPSIATLSTVLDITK